MQMRGALAIDEKKRKTTEKKNVENLSRVMWWCVGACRGRTDLKLFRTTNREENNKALFSSSSYSFFLFDWIPPFFSFLIHTDTYTKKKKTENSKLYQQPTLCVCVCVSFLSWSRLICLLEPFGGHLLHYTAMQSIRFHSTTKNTKPSKKQKN